MVERLNQSVMAVARCMMKAKGLSGYFSGEAITTIVYLFNRSLTRSMEGMIPYEAWLERQPSLSHLRTFRLGFLSSQAS
jgi:hypothetical protein